jgi:hypothetical protein
LPLLTKLSGNNSGSGRYSRMKLRALLAPTLLLAGCTAVPPAVPPPEAEPVRPGPMMPWTPQPSGLRFSVESATAAPGATIALVLHNGTAHDAGYNLCSSALEQLQSGRWLAIPENRACTRELRIVRPGQQGRYQLRLPATLPTGTYRFRTGAELQTNTPQGTTSRGHMTVYSEAFTVPSRR